MYILLPLLSKINAIVATIVSMFSIICATYCGWSVNWELIQYAGPFPLLMMFFCLGITLAKSNRNYNLTIVTICLVLALGLQYAEYRFLLDKNLAAMGIKPSSFVFSLCATLCLFHKKVEKAYNDCCRVNRILCYLGDRSFGIYLIHYIIFILARAKSVYPSNWVLGYFIIFGITLIVIELLRRVLPKKVQKYLGV